MAFSLTRKRKQKLIITLVVLVGVAIAVALLLYAFKQNLNLFFTPSQLLAHQAPVDQRIQVGGLVVKGSLQRDVNSLKVRFTLSDLKQQVDVEYTGILPDLFREGQGIIANGYYRNGKVEAEEILAKHDEKYMPPQLKQAMEEGGHPDQSTQ
jgi:cytochrome c-type biogenesis protein CcmE